MEAVKISYSDPRVKQIIRDCFSEYRGRKVKVDDHIPNEIHSYWDEGTKHSFCWYQPSTRKVFHIHSNHPQYEQNQPRSINLLLVPDDVLLVEHIMFCGHDLGIRIHVKPNQINFLTSQEIKQIMVKEEAE